MMKEFSIWVPILFGSCLLFGVYKVNAACEDNNLNPDNEENGTELQTFLENLEKFTGLKNGEAKTVTLTNCEKKTCIINPNGTVIWDARMDLYSNNMMAAKETDDAKKTTLDGCLCFSKTEADFQSCMETVRSTMNTELISVLLPNFISAIDKNCTLYDENCVTS